jgi:hypothetical protein
MARASQTQVVRCQIASDGAHLIRLQTALKHDIPNLQFSEISAFERNWAADLPTHYPEATFRTALCARYNCHGLTFASRRTRIAEGSSIALIRVHDNYDEIERRAVLPGDLVVYYDDDGDATHSGIVVANEEPLFVPIIVSKWGSGPEAIHRYFDVPQVYGTNHVFLRCQVP